MSGHNIDVLIIGAGPSGCVAAAYLHKKGLNVKIVEKLKFPRFVIGESLLPKSMEHFEEVDLLDCLHAQNFEKKRGARFLRGNEECLFDFSKKFTEGWNWTWQVPRADFDKALADEIIKRGVNIAFEWTVTNVKFNGTDSISTIQNKKGEEQTINAKFVIDSSGYGRVLPRLLGLDIPSSIPKHSSIFTHLKDVKRPEGEEGTLITFDIVKPDVWLWVIPFSNGTTSIGFVGPTDFIESYGKDKTVALQEMMKLSNYYYNRFSNVDFSFEPVKIKNIAKSVKKMFGDGYALTGNSAEFLDPVFSSGVAFATESALKAAKLAAKQVKGETVNWQKDYEDYMLKGIDVFSSYVKEWYTTNLQKLFFHRPENPEVKEKICAVLAGYVWDEENTFVKKHHRAVTSMAHLIDMENEQKKAAF